MQSVRELRKRLGLPIDGLAYKAGVSARHIVLWERYGMPPRNRTTLEKIARALGMEPDELLAITGNGSETNGSAQNGSELKEVSEV